MLAPDARAALGGTIGSAGLAPGASPIGYSSSDQSVTVDSEGRLAGVTAGTAIVTARLNAQSSAYKVRVRAVRFRSIHAGGTENVCGITVDNELLCWGRAWSAGVQTELRSDCAKGGTCSWGGTMDDVPELARVATDVKFADVSLGQGGSCGIDVDGRGFCWGGNVDGTKTCNTVTGRCSVEPRVLATNAKFSRIAASDSYASAGCGITTDSAALCWGFQSSGELGGGPPILLSPTAVATPQPVKALSMPYAATCWLLADGGVWCVGERQYFGNSTALNPGFASGTGAGGMHFTRLAGFICGLSADSLAYCWFIRTLPTAPAPAQRFVDVQSAITFGCGLTAGGDIYCWGYNGYGQLGNGTTSSSPDNPAQRVVGGYKWRSLSVGGLHVCAMTVDDVAYCWGNRPQSLGNSAARNDVAPRRVPGQM